MSDTSWDLEEFDPATREAIEAAAAEAGVSAEQYVADRLLLSLLVDARDGAEADDEGAAFEPEAEAAPAPQRPRQRESFALTHRLEAVERRLGQAVSGIEDAIAAFDQSIVGLGGRVDETDAFIDENSEAVDLALSELRNAVDALDIRISQGDANIDQLGRAHDSLRAQVLDDGAFFEQRLSVLEEVARGAEAHGVALAEGQEQLKRAIGSDFIAYALETDEKLATQADQVADALVATRARIETVAGEAEAAGERMLADLLAAADTLSRRVSEDLSRANGRIDAAFDHASGLGEALAQRVSTTDQAVTRLEDQLNTRLAHQGRDMRAALAELAGSLEHANSEHAAGLARVESEARTALEQTQKILAGELDRVDRGFGAELDRTREDLRSELAQLGGRQQDTATLVRQLDANSAKTSADFTEHRDATEARFARNATDFAEHRDATEARFSHTAAEMADLRDAADIRAAETAAQTEQRLARAQADMQQRIQALTTRVDNSVSLAQTANKVVADEVIRVETCTLAALESAAQQRKADHEALRQELQHARHAQTAELEQTQHRIAAEITDLRDQNRGTMARLNLADEGLAACGRVIDAASTQVSALNARLDRVESGANSGDAKVHETLNALVSRLGALELDTEALKQDDLVGRLQEMQAHLAAQHLEDGEAAERVSGLARVVGQLSAHTAEAAAQNGERLHKLELAVADLRLEAIAEPGAEPSAATIEQHVGALRRDASEALEELHVRLLGLEQNTTAHDFEALRHSLEDRHLALEAKTVRALDQLTRTVALLSRKFALEVPPEAPPADVAQTG